METASNHPLRVDRCLGREDRMDFPLSDIACQVLTGTSAVRVFGLLEGVRLSGLMPERNQELAQTRAPLRIDACWQLSVLQPDHLVGPD